ncbi:MAG: anti-sigma factor family protein [Pirellulaceae bacterium]
MSEPGDLRWDEDLLSGYLDGELSEPQQQLVRQRLTSDPAARDLLRRLVEQREQMLRCNDAIPMIDLSRRIAERIAPVDPAVRPQRPTDANGSRSAWRFAAALLAASLVGILIGPWFLRSRTEVTLQSPASQSSSARWDAAEFPGELESANRADGLAGKPFDTPRILKEDLSGMAGVAADRLGENIEADRQGGEGSGGSQVEQVQDQDRPADRFALDRSDPRGVEPEAPRAEMSGSLKKQEPLGFAIEQEDRARFGRGQGASGGLGEPSGPGGGGGLGSAGGLGGMASGGLRAGAAPGAPREVVPGAGSEGAGMGRASGRGESRGLAEKQQRESIPAPAPAAAGKSKELEEGEAESLYRETKDNGSPSPRRALSRDDDEGAEKPIDSFFSAGRLMPEDWQAVRLPTDPEWNVQSGEGSWLLDVPAFFWPTLYQRMIESGWSIEESGQEILDAGGAKADTRLNNPRMPRVDNPQSVELGQWYRGKFVSP